MKNIYSKIILGSLLFSVISNAMAHDIAGATSGFLSGLWHPFSGLDHLLVMLGIGLWAASMQNKQSQQPYFMLPVAFLVVMLLGAILAFNQFTLQALEMAIAITVMLIGLLLLTQITLPVSVAILLSSGFALFHGNAHGLEITPGSSALSYMIGFICSTALLHFSGYSLGQGCMAKNGFKQLFGLVSCLLGSSLMMFN
jgi:urease accessory protein